MSLISVTWLMGLFAACLHVVGGRGGQMKNKAVSVSRQSTVALDRLS